MAELIFGKYEIVRRIAVGGMGEVFAARQTGVPGFERWVILKSLLPELAELPEMVDQFLDEARVAATLNHPNIVALYEVGLWQGTYYLAMEFIPGHNLSQLMRAAAKAGVEVPWPIAAYVVREAALGLDHAHHASDSRGNALKLVHRDVSPHNIMVRSDGLTKVVDFGIARASNRATRTATGTIKGKLAYMAPEQLKSEGVDEKSDQFSLGVVLHELLSGKRLFEGPDAELVRAVLTRPIPSPCVAKPGIPTELGELTLKMLKRDPSQRFERLRDAAAELELILRKHPVDPAAVGALLEQLLPTGSKDTSEISPHNFLISLREPGSSQATVPIRPGTATRRRRGRWALALSALVVLGGGLGTWRLTMSEPVPVPVPAPVVIAVEPPAPVVEPKPEPEPAHAPPVKPEPTPEPQRPARHKTPLKPGSLTLNSSPWAKVRIDGKWVGVTPLSAELPAGRHDLELKNDEKAMGLGQSIDIAPGKALRLNLVLQPLR